MLEKRIEGETCYDGYFPGVEESMGLVGVGSWRGRYRPDSVEYN